ncbi:MAG: DUF3299 domain-containing protein [candidate division NC10 bacterium]|nr:DUF3299 domain-containing protein [candidate division NC10 bacterium]
MKTKSCVAMILSVALIGLGEGLWNVSLAQKKTDKKEEGKGTKVRVIEERGPTGHQTIGIEESTIVEDPGKELSLTFSTLMTWPYELKGNSPPPETVKRLDGHRVRIIGFMYPLQEGASIQYFCLLRSTQTCCYGPRPQYNQYIFVEMAKPTTFYRLDPVACIGKFKVDPAPEEGFIYRMEGERCELVAEKER